MERRVARAALYRRAGSGAQKMARELAPFRARANGSRARLFPAAAGARQTAPRALKAGFTARTRLLARLLEMLLVANIFATPSDVDFILTCFCKRIFSSLCIGWDVWAIFIKREKIVLTICWLSSFEGGNGII